MNNLFALAANETTAGSVFFLNSIFGTIGNVLGGTGPALLGAMFQVFNTSVLALGSILVSYTTFSGILLTAHEGEALGKKFHGLWIPLRTVAGIAALVPTASGYSYLQIALMWFIIQGIGAADTLWTTTVNYVASGGSTAPNPAGGAPASLQLQFGQLFQALTCQAAAKASYGSGYFCSDNPNDSFCTATDVLSVSSGSSQVSNGVYNMGPSGICGSLTLGDSSSIGQAKNQAFSQIVPTLGSLANQLVAVDYGYTSFIDGSLTNPTPPPSWASQYCSDHNVSGANCNASAFSAYPSPTPSNGNQSTATVTDLYWQYGLSSTAGGNFLTTAANLYTGIVGTAMSSNSNSNNNLNAVKTTATSNGWIFAGGYFYYIAQANNKIATNVGSITVSPPNMLSLPLATEQVLTSAANTLVTNIMKNYAAPSSNDLGINTSCGSSSYSGGGDALCSQIIGSWVNALSGSSGGGLSQNPVIAAQSTGHEILTIVEIIVPIFLVATIALELASGIWAGTGWPAAATVINQTIVPVAMFFVVLFLGIGVTLAVYTPMIPYMLFTFGAINWLIGAIETMVATPLIAIGLLHPEGGENLWGKAEHALMLLLNLFLRPSLMIFGMIGGMLMSFTVVMMINYAFLNVVSMVSGQGANVIEMIFFMVIYTSLFTTSMNKCFDLIHIMPGATRFIGGDAKFGEEGGLDKVGGAVEGGSQKAGGAAQSTVAGGGAATKGGVKARAAAEKKKKATEDAGKTTGTKPATGKDSGTPATGGTSTT